DQNPRVATRELHGRYLTLNPPLVSGRERTVRGVRAGHDPAIVYDPQADEFTELAGADIPLAVDPEWTYTEAHRNGMKPGDIICIGTDGIWESRNLIGEMYGKERLRKVIRDNASRTSQEISDAVVVSLAEFREGRAQLDDVTLVVIKWVEEVA
ncbi:MAG: PP2C family protein-serine/threonine phosphatase, partial [Planctomycetota bacterium]|nr:PP2C family protein-serine/threonine phosphatase [Planctomycetota bacterium]